MPWRREPDPCPRLSPCTCGGRRIRHIRPIMNAVRASGGSVRSESFSRISAVLGPTYTGKTHFAIERMLAHRSGMIGLPLRLLAREVYDRIVRLKGPQDVALITGEEK